MQKKQNLIQKFNNKTMKTIKNFNNFNEMNERKLYEPTEVDIQRLKDSRERLTNAIMDFKKNPDKYKTPKYITDGGDKIAVLDEDFLDNGNRVVSGVIVDSPSKVYIGLTNTFIYPREIKEIEE